MFKPKRRSINFAFQLFLLLVFALIAFSSTGKTSLEVEGYITELDLVKQGLKIGGNWYYLDNNSVITRNGLKTSLLSCQPISGQYQWGKALLKSQMVSRLSIEYKVYEGRIERISLAGQWLELSIFLQQTTDSATVKRFNWQTSITDGSKVISKLHDGDHVVIIAAGGLILRILSE